MKNNSSTKRALLGSVLSIVLCLAMFIGTTAAWFVDSASTSVNKIQAGRLDVALLDADGNSVEGKTLAWQKAMDGAGQTVLWEPGCTYDLQPITIKNNNNLALKYKIIITGILGDAELNKAIEWKIKVNESEVTLADYEGTLLSTEDGNSHTFTISGTMKPTAGNEYMGLSIDGIAITVVATQAVHEYDSTVNDYDENAEYAEYSVGDADALKEALAAGGFVSLVNDIAIVPEGTGDTLIPQMTVTDDTIINLEGKTLGVDSSVYEQGLTYTPSLISVDGGTLTINGDGVITAEAGNNNSYGIDVNGGNLVINGGSYYGALTAVQVEKGSVVINGGFFDLAPTCKADVPQYAKYVVNCIDSAFKDGTATISITGGTFVNFDPSANPEGAGTTYVAEGYKVVAELQANGETWYTVVPEA